ncbi:MAG: phosphoglucosamine mutase [Acidimicrobiales bacterium]
MTLKFGTDGVRGRAYEELTVSGVEALAIAAGTVLGGDAIVIGADTRESGPDFMAALARGFAHCGIPSWSLGVAPTPAVAHVAAQHGIVGAVVSASHNPFYDNGIKFFSAEGRKLTNDQQAALELELANQRDTVEPAPAAPVDRSDLVADYVQWVQSTVAPRALTQTRVVVDCANGAASAIAAQTLAGLGAHVTAINDHPDGRNINANNGSTDMSGLSEAVLAGGAQLGIALDGDADRMLAVDAHGGFVDGDQLIGICAIDLHERGRLNEATVVVTVMTNLGFRIGMQQRGLAVHETPVGDRHVLEALAANRWSLGGEQSGHVIFSDIATTGDGLLTAVQLLDVMARSGSGLAELAANAMTRLPQRLRNVTVEGSPADVMDALAEHIQLVEATLGTTGRVLVRPSGTEPLIRVMAEAPTQPDADAAVDYLIEALRTLGGPLRH